MATKYAWWGYVKSMVRKYPDYCRELAEMKSSSGQSDGIRSMGKVSDPTAQMALLTLPGVKQKEMEAVEKAIRTCSNWANGDTRIKMVDLIYWKRSHTLTGSAIKLNISYDRAKQYHTQFLREVAKNFGLL